MLVEQKKTRDIDLSIWYDHKESLGEEKAESLGTGCNSENATIHCTETDCTAT